MLLVCTRVVEPPQDMPVWNGQTGPVKQPRGCIVLQGGLRTFVMPCSRTSARPSVCKARPPAMKRSTAWPRDRSTPISFNTWAAHRAINCDRETTAWEAVHDRPSSCNLKISDW